MKEEGGSTLQCFPCSDYSLTYHYYHFFVSCENLSGENDTVQSSQCVFFFSLDWQEFSGNFRVPTDIRECLPYPAAYSLIRPRCFCM